MKDKHLYILLFLYGTAITGICVYSFLTYSDSFETPIPHEHGFWLSEPEESLQLELNAATAAQLAKIPGVSRPLAEKITEYRREIGGFTSLSQLREVPGMPQALFVTLGNYLFLTPVETSEPSEPVTETAISATELPTELLLDLNTATIEELCLLPGIGESMAAEIVEFRRKVGKFVNRRQLLSVNGIGEATLSRISGHLYIENEQPIQEETTAATDPPEIPMININTATAEQLLVLPHCTVELAENVIYLREHIHGFVNILEVFYTEGITAEIYAAWEPYLAVDDEGNTKIKKPDSP